MYAFNISLNYSNNLIDFYDWSDKDNIVLIKKIPLFLVNDRQYQNLLYNKVIFAEKFYEIIKDKTILKDDKYETSILVSNGVNAFGIKINNRNSTFKSYLDVMDEAEVGELSSNLSVYNIDFEVIGPDYIHSNLTRNSKYVLNSIVLNLEKSKSVSGKLEYLYYEWFKKMPENKSFYDELVEDINKSFTYKHIEFLKSMELLNMNK